MNSEPYSRSVGSQSEIPLLSKSGSICEVNGSDDSNEKLINDFAGTWAKVINSDRLDT